jgi:hypothetical protein
MLKQISLYAINEILDSASEISPISPMSKMIYINCLIHNFENKKPTIANSVAFDLLTSDFDFEKFKKNFHELHKAELIIINGDVITFSNTWGKYIDRTKLDCDDEDSYKGENYSFIPAEKIDKTIFTQNQTLIEICQMKHKLKEAQIDNLIDLFLKEQVALKKTYQGEQDCLKHFMNWLNYNKEKTTINAGGNVKSKGKLLGK